MRPDSRNLIASAALISFFFVIPGFNPAPPGIGNTLILMLLAASGILISRIFVLSSELSLLLLCSSHPGVCLL